MFRIKMFLKNKSRLISFSIFGIIVIIIIIFFISLKRNKRDSGCRDLNKVETITFHRVGRDKEQDFIKKMEFLIKNNFTPVSISEIYDFRVNHRKLPLNPVIIIFDDGYPSWYNFVFPYLKKKNIKATFFVTTNFAGGIFPWKMINDIKNYKNLLGKNIFEIGSHSVSHDDKIFSQENNKQTYEANVLYELFYSKKIIEDNINKQITFFSIPFGGLELYSTKTSILLKIAKDVGYKVVLGANYFVIPGKYVMTAGRLDDSFTFEQFKNKILPLKNHLCL